MTTRDDWLSSAISDDRIVAQLLLRLHHHHHSTTSSLVLPPRWGVRHPRSRMVFTCDLSQDKKRDSSRNSPTTPLAWSVVAVESTSLDPRSKAVIADEPTNPDANKSKKNETSAQLKEEEVSRLKERVHFNEELATMRTIFKESTATNENSKRIKLDFHLNSSDGATTATYGKGKTALTLEEKPILICRTSSTSQSSSCFRQASLHAEEQGRGFLLPDLNMTPSEHDFSLDREEEIQVMSI